MTQQQSIPEYITVHLGAADSNAPNLTLPFFEYLQNAASSELSPLWHPNALTAGVYSIATLAHNRIFFGYYRSRGYGFDITNNPEEDQSFIPGREIYTNISQVVGSLFGSYISSANNTTPIESLLSRSFGDSPGRLNMIEAAELADEGAETLEILSSSFGEDIKIINNASFGDGTLKNIAFPLFLGSRGRDVRDIQVMLNRVSDKYISIPKIAWVSGVFEEDTADAIKEFQRIAGMPEDGIITRAVYLALRRVFDSIKRLCLVNFERQKLNQATQITGGKLSLGASGDDVVRLQFLLWVLSCFRNTIPKPVRSGVFDSSTLLSVLDAQRTLGLIPDGIVGGETRRAIYDAYLGIIDSLPDKYSKSAAEAFGGTTLRFGSDSDTVGVLQHYLSTISKAYPEVPIVNVTGYFGNHTQKSLSAAQDYLGLPPTGTADESTWDAVAALYSDLHFGSRLHEGQYSGYVVG